MCVVYAPNRTGTLTSPNYKKGACVLNAIYIDYHQLHLQCGKSGISMDDAMTQIVEMGLEKGEISEIRLFVPTYLNDTRPWHTINELEKKFGVEVSVCPTLTEESESGIKMKDAVDAKVLVWVKTHLHKGVTPNLVIFVTGDADFIVIAHEVKKKGKKVEFWSVDTSNVNSLIKRQETFAIIKPASQPENPFTESLQKIIDEKPVDEKDRWRFAKIAQLIVLQRKKPVVKRSSKEAVNHVSLLISADLGISFAEAKDLLGALMTLEVARIYPVIDRIVNIDASSNLFESIAFHA